ncbi:T9SS type A sorting domain-containing protein [Panacibacter sp. DH6]|uniref:T9SS type A sorting domain-containing protein n=1 Tax=Panacibacter microcysteis TaxID=2793269 RepID=A0A931GY64_9BACT|nr:T9SS type A sorting domain-containing protein [Panacibacter microcysteis]MBG9377489.1 T9SS type A sorting domain-containing protein [Panacibacter microcysteis]
MKKSTFSILLLAVCVLANAQVKDTVFSDNKQNGVWVKNGIDIQTLNPDCSVATNLFQAWDEATSSYVTRALTTYTYDEAGNVASILSQVWDALAGSWINSGRSIYTYSSDGRYFTNLSQGWDLVNKQWINSFRIRVEFNADGTTNTSQFDLYDASLGWLAQARTFNTYDDQQRVINFVYQYYVNNAWVNNSRTTFDYSKGGLSFSYYWDPFNAVWVKSQRGFNDYLPGTAVATKQLYQSYTGSSWLNQSRTSTNYNAANLVERARNEVWDVATAGWINGFRVNSGYYSDGSQQYFKFESWDAFSNAWSFGYRATYTNNACATTIDFTPSIEMLTDDKSENRIKKLLATQANLPKAWITERSFASGNRQIAVTVKRKLAVKRHAVQAAPQHNNLAAGNKVLLSPNPAKGYFTLNLGSYKMQESITMIITDLSGKKIMQQQLAAGSVQQVALPNVQKGMYIVSVIAGKSIQTHKLMVE